MMMYLMLKDGDWISIEVNKKTIKIIGMCYSYTVYQCP